jgi:hypothetical protein
VSIVYSLGALFDKPDSRDFLLSNYLPLTVSRPAEYILNMSPVKYQAGLGSCTAFGFAAMVEYFNGLEFNKVLDMSEQDLYGETKKTDGYAGEGSYPKAVADVLLKRGVCEERFFPYEGRYPPLGTPLAGYIDNASTYRIKNYAIVNTDFDSIKDAIFVNGPVGFSIKVNANFTTIGSDGKVPMPAGVYKGGHWMCATGYLNLPGEPILAKNSWSNRWGKAGYCIFYKDAWDAMVMGAMTIVDLTNIQLPWLDWPSTEIETGFKVKASGLMQGYPNGAFYPNVILKKRHVYLIAQRLGKQLDKMLEEDYTDATRGWVKEQIPYLPWNSTNWDDPITRGQMALLIGRTL